MTLARLCLLSLAALKVNLRKRLTAASSRPSAGRPGSFFAQAGVVSFGLAALCFAGGCGASATPTQAPAEQAALAITSEAFQPGGAIDARYTYDGENVSPPLAWSGAPEQTQSFVVLMERPGTGDEPTAHWVLYDLPGSVTKLDAGVPRGKALDSGAKQGTNDFREDGYSGPAQPRPGQDSAPAAAEPVRYVFRVYALDKRLGLPGGRSRFQTIAAMGGHILAEGELTGTYSR